jgi:hypothetical protein
LSFSRKDDSHAHPYRCFYQGEFKQNLRNLIFIKAQTFSKASFGLRESQVSEIFLCLAVPCVNKLKKRSLENYIDFTYKANSLIEDVEAAGTPVIRLHKGAGTALKPTQDRKPNLAFIRGITQAIVSGAELSKREGAICNQTTPSSFLDS